MPQKPRRVVILGGGFGGVHTFLRLRRLAKRGRINLTLISREDHFLFTPLLHEVVSGRIRSSSIRILLPELLRGKNTRFICSEVLRINLAERTVITRSAPIHYDILVISLGAKVNFFGVHGAESLSTLKTLRDAEMLSESLTKLSGGERSNPRRIVVVGGGATGVEVSVEIADMFSERLKARTLEILLLEASHEILPGTHPYLKEVAKRSLKKCNIEMRMNSVATKVTDKYLEVSGGKKILFDLALWTAGTRAVAIPLMPTQPKDKSERIKTLPTLQLENHLEVFALGDIACGFPMTAQVAVAQSKIVAKNIAALVHHAPLQKFDYKSAGMLFSLGRWMAGAEVKVYLLNKPLYFWGAPAWVFWHIAYAARVPGMKNKLSILFDWMRDILKHI